MVRCCRVPEDSLVCEWNEHDFESLEIGMGFHQLAVRLLVWLSLNHIQIFISRVVFSWLPAKTKEQDCKERSVCVAVESVQTVSVIRQPTHKWLPLFVPCGAG